LTAPTAEKCYVVAGDKFGTELKSRVLKIVMAGNHSMHTWHHSCKKMKFIFCGADPEGWA